MSIISYIQGKKEKFRNQQQANRTQSIIKKEKKLADLEIKNKVREQDLDVERRLRREEAKGSILNSSRKTMRNEKIRNSVAGKIAGNIKNKVVQARKEAKERNNPRGTIFSQQPSYNNPFSTSGSAGSNPFSQGNIGRNVFSGSEASKKNRR